MIALRNAPGHVCGGCRYWSEMIAYVYGGGPVRAACLAPGVPQLQYTASHQTCDRWASGHLGALDDPSEDPARYAHTSGCASTFVYVDEDSGGNRFEATDFDAELCDCKGVGYGG